MKRCGSTLWLRGLLAFTLSLPLTVTAQSDGATAAAAPAATEATTVPATPPAADVATAPAAPTATDAVVTPDAQPTAPIPVPSPPTIAGQPGILVLPVEYTVFQSSTGAFEPVPEWTEQARHNLDETALHVASADGRFHVIDMPKLTADQTASLREHVELFKVIGTQLESVVKLGGKPFQDVRDNADYRVGNGLAFLKQMTGATSALVLAGAQVRQSGGSIFMQLLIGGLTGFVPAGGGGSYMYAGVIDLETGRVTWFGSHLGVMVFGMGGGPDVRKAEGAETALTRLFKNYPYTDRINLGSGMTPKATAATAK